MMQTHESANRNTRSSTGEHLRTVFTNLLPLFTNESGNPQHESKKEVRTVAVVLLQTFSVLSGGWRRTHGVDFPPEDQRVHFQEIVMFAGLPSKPNFFEIVDYHSARSRSFDSFHRTSRSWSSSSQFRTAVVLQDIDKNQRCLFD